MTDRLILLTAAFWAGCILLSIETQAADRLQPRTGWRPTKAVLVSGSQVNDEISDVDIFQTETSAVPLPDDEMSSPEKHDDEASTAAGKASVSDSPAAKKTPSKKSPAKTPTADGGADASESKVLEGDEKKPAFESPFSDAV